MVLKVNILILMNPLNKKLFTENIENIEYETALKVILNHEVDRLFS